MSSTNENKHIRNVRRRATSALTSLHLDTINPSLRGVIVCHRSYLLLIAAAKVPAVTETRGRGPRKQTSTHLQGLFSADSGKGGQAGERRCPPGVARG